MKALQLHYTSCRRGQSGSAGFQTRSMTPGISLDEQRAIERHGIYRPPRDARQEPSGEEMARDFPLALRWYHLDSGRSALTRCHYTGRDYSGRWGNFFAHTLVLDPGPFPDLWPIDYYEWSGWREGLTATEDGEEDPLPLPMADLGGLTPAESFAWGELRDFLREEPGRPELLAKMGRAVLLGQSSSRALVIRDTPTGGLYWLACLQKLFPKAHAQALSYSTYQDDPRGCAAVNATTGETHFTFDDPARRFRFYLFDLATGVHSDVPDAADDYPAVAARWLAEDPLHLARFFEFMRLFEHRQPGPELIAAVDLFEFAHGALPALEGERLGRALAFAAGHATTAGKAQLLELLSGAAARASGGPALVPADHEQLIRFLAEAAGATGRADHRALAYGAWQSLVRESVVARGLGLASAMSAWGHLRLNLAAQAAELAASCLADPAWRGLEEDLQRVSSETVAFLLRVAWDNLETVGRQPAWEQPEIESLAAMLLTRAGELAASTQVVLEAVPREPAPVAAVALRLARGWGRGTGEDVRREDAVAVGRALGRMLAAWGTTSAAEVRRSLAAEEAWDLLFGEWLELCEGAADPLAAFDHYREAILDDLPSYAQWCASWVAASLLDRVPSGRRPALSLGWLRSGLADGFQQDLARECVQHANREIPLDLTAGDGDESARIVAAAAARLRLSLQPDRPLLRQVLRVAEGPRGPLERLRLPEVHRAVAELTLEEYPVFLAAFLPAALAWATLPRVHERILHHVCRDDCHELCVQSYLSFFQAKRETPWPRCLDAALGLWLGFDRREEHGRRHLAPLEEIAKQGLTVALGRLKPKELNDVRRRHAPAGGRAAKCWDEILDRLEKSKRSSWSKLVGVFARR